MGLFDNGYDGGFRLDFRVLIGLAIALFGVISYFTHTSVNPVTGESQHVSMSPQQEIALGLQSAPEMTQQMGGEVPRDDVESQEVRYVGNSIARSSDAAKSPYNYEYHLLADSQTINAFALPGGQVFITKGLYEKLADEAELAGVLGHESGHVVERHSAQQLEKSKLGNMLVTGVAVGASNQRNGYSAAMVAGVVNQMTQLSFSRTDESQADECGLRFMTQAGYDPRAMIDVMKVLLAASQGGRQPEFLSTHPYPEDRIRAITASLQQAYPNGVPANLGRGKPLPRDSRGF